MSQSKNNYHVRLAIMICYLKNLLDQRLLRKQCYFLTVKTAYQSKWSIMFNFEVNIVFMDFATRIARLWRWNNNLMKGISFHS